MTLFPCHSCEGRNLAAPPPVIPTFSSMAAFPCHSCEGRNLAAPPPVIPTFSSMAAFLVIPAFFVIPAKAGIQSARQGTRWGGVGWGENVAWSRGMPLTVEAP